MTDEIDSKLVIVFVRKPNDHSRKLSFVRPKKIGHSIFLSHGISIDGTHYAYEIGVIQQDGEPDRAYGPFVDSTDSLYDALVKTERGLEEMFEKLGYAVEFR